MNRIIQQGDAAAEDAAKNFRYNQAKSGRHGPAKYRRAQSGMAMAGMTVVSMTLAVGVRMSGVTVVVRMGMSGHRHHSTRSMKDAQPFPALIRQYDTQSLVID